VQAIQLELAQLNYMDEYSFAWDEAKAVTVRQHLLDLLRLALD
jgi:N-formylglutamate deformylase